MPLVFVIGCATKPAPGPQTIPVVIVEAGPTDLCQRAAAENANRLSAIAARYGISEGAVVNACEAYCAPFAADGPDAASEKCLFGAENLHLIEGGTP